MKPLFQKKLKLWMKKKIPFRFHMSIIMFSTVSLGIVVNALLVNTFGVIYPYLRYPLVVIFSYAWFLLFIRIYIKQILVSSSSSKSYFEFLDIPASHSSSRTDCGGKFTDNSASGKWLDEETVSEVAKKSIEESTESGISAFFEDQGSVFILIVGALLAVVAFGSGIYLVWHSPEILSECLIQVILVSGMRKNMKKFSEKEWISHIFKVTIWPFLGVLIFSLLLGLFLRFTCPDANNLRDYSQTCFRRLY